MVRKNVEPNMKEPNHLKEEIERLGKLYQEKETNLQRLFYLYDVVQTINLNLPTQEILGTIANCAKKLTQTEKMVLGLIDPETAGFNLDPASIVVRGSRAQHPESLWQKKIQDVTEVVLKRSQPTLIPTQKFAGGQSSILCLPLKAQGKSLGILSAINSSAHHLDDEKIKLLTILANIGGTAVDNVRSVERNQQLLLANERSRIAKDIHDGLAQSLYSIVLNLEVCSKKLISIDPPDIREKLIQVQALASKGLRETRQYIYNLHPPGLERLGLVATFRNVINEFQEIHGISTDFMITGEQKTQPVAIEETLYHILQEALANVIKHAQASSVTIGLEFNNEQILLTIKDDGRGFDVNKAFLAARTKGGMGLTNMTERAKSNGGKCIIKSRPGLGTEISVVVPR